VARALVDALGTLPAGRAPPLLGGLAAVAGHSAWTSLVKGASDDTIVAANRVLFGRLAANLLAGAGSSGASAAFEASLQSLCASCCSSDNKALQHMGITLMCEALVLAKEPATNAKLASKLSSMLTAQLPALEFRAHTIFAVSSFSTALNFSVRSEFLVDLACMSDAS
jgi:hypothetical protein